mmetsp:Transcript_28791/g.33109  ORF Transcript_28791/g.33109 Transcript_28791/m.33109 type:complete len:83 (-) Transcript_28791:8-256(-)|eukprot:CAMPEP_0194397824 /NCGR_PEP_ID=MMETSP0174-20130528/125760_1 /TAXON_ID=216777 /ORGANISM="Proboscia alata, Strain PI-D3" /LENGTH=82 /DNA_ID=CAMNT_0039194047 /DNA_START=461 /DNA_END=709 /DNA_ORIENTATION=+
MTPIWEGVNPFFASLHTWSSTSAALIFCHEGGLRLYGKADLEIPFPGACIRPMIESYCEGQERQRGTGDNEGKGCNLKCPKR